VPPARKPAARADNIVCNADRNLTVTPFARFPKPGGRLQEAVLLVRSHSGAGFKLSVLLGAPSGTPPAPMYTLEPPGP